ncbi:MAG: HIT family protein [Candidatus Diapherotrites archaeon]
MTVECKFCLLAQEKVPIARVFESGAILAFMDRAPVNPGHVLVIPKKHVSEFQELDDPAFSEIMLAAKKIAKAVKKVTQCKKVGILIAGFDVPHAHVHVIPMFDAKDVCTKRVFEKEFVQQPLNVLKDFAEQISSKLDNA